MDHEPLKYEGVDGSVFWQVQFPDKTRAYFNLAGVLVRASAELADKLGLTPAVSFSREAAYRSSQETWLLLHKQRKLKETPDD